MKKICIALMCLLIPSLGFSAATFYAYGDTTYAVITPRNDATPISEFEHEQEQLLAWVRDVNYYTRIGVTERDMRIIKTFLDLVTLGLSNTFFDDLFHGLSSRVLAISTKGIEWVHDEAIEDELTRQAVLLGLEDLYARIVKRPFLLLLLGKDQYNDLVEQHPEVGTLFNNMWTFFYHRSVLLGEEFNRYIDNIERMSRRGKANPFKVWEVLAEYAQQDFQNIADEQVALHNLKYHMQQIQIEERIKAEVRKMAQQDKKYPSNKQLRQEKKKRRQSRTIKGRAKSKYEGLKDNPEELKQYLEGIE